MRTNPFYLKMLTCQHVSSQGDSAGGNLAHHVAVRACKAGLQKIWVIGLISIQPFFGGEERTEAEIRLEGSLMILMARTDWMWKVFLPEGSNWDHGAANVSGPNAEDLSGFGLSTYTCFCGRV
jgi:acetyl esterase/lipase